jgi:hypothetical protein
MRAGLPGASQYGGVCGLGIVGGLLIFEVSDRREDGAGWISAGGAKDLEEGDDADGLVNDCLFEG